jgi:hypothetical protein
LRRRNCSWDSKLMSSTVKQFHAAKAMQRPFLPRRLLIADCYRRPKVCVFSLHCKLKRMVLPIAPWQNACCKADSGGRINPEQMGC